LCYVASCMHQIQEHQCAMVFKLFATQAFHFPRHPTVVALGRHRSDCYPGDELFHASSAHFPSGDRDCPPRGQSDSQLRFGGRSQGQDRDVCLKLALLTNVSCRSTTGLKSSDRVPDAVMNLTCCYCGRWHCAWASCSFSGCLWEESSLDLVSDKFLRGDKAIKRTCTL